MQISADIRNVFYMEGTIDAFYDASFSVLVIRLFKLNTGKVRSSALKRYIDVVTENNIRNLVIDTSEARGMHLPPDEQFFLDHTFPTIARLGFSNLIQIFPKNRIARIGVRSFNEAGNKFNIHFRQVKNLAEAFAVIGCQELITENF